MPENIPTPEADTPIPPDIGTRTLLKQFWLDIYGKEVQSAATYSYLWMADQMGHVCIGIIIDMALSALITLGWERLGWGDGLTEGLIGGFVVTAAIVSYWEYSAFTTSIKESTWQALLDGRTLARNAIIAAGYMIIGAALGLAFRLAVWDAFVVGSALAVLAVLLAPPWLRQKITWQKASLPYLFRLADAKKSVGTENVKLLKNLLVAGAPPAAPPRQVIVVGPIGSGRTSLAAGIGTEFAFAKCTVRYLGFDRLLEFAYTSKPQNYSDDPGPRNIGYWPWAKSQVLIIDDIAPVVAGHPSIDPLADFRKHLKDPLERIRSELGRRHTVWVIGDLADGDAVQVQAFVKAIQEFCDGQEPLLIHLQPLS